MADPTLSIALELFYAPQPSLLRGAASFERALKGGLVRHSGPTEIPIIYTDTANTMTIVVGPESYVHAVEPLQRMDRFGPSASTLAACFVRQYASIVPRELELRTMLVIPVPNALGSVGGYNTATFAWPRKLELRPEQLGKDHFMPTETGIVHVRLSTHIRPEGHELRLLLANRHDRVSSDPEVVEQSFALCLRGILSVVDGLATPAYKRCLAPLLAARKG